MKNRNLQFKPAAGLLIPLLACLAAGFISAPNPATHALCSEINTKRKTTMKKKSASQFAYFNLRLLTGLFLALACVFQFGNPGAAFSGNYTVEGDACAWSAGPDMPSVGVRSVGVYFPFNRKFYAMGGRSSDAPGSDFMHPFEYDPATNTWTTKSATYPDNQVSNMACAVLGGVQLLPLIYCVGGSAAGQTTATARVFYYDPVADTITTLTGADNWPGDSSGTILPGGFAVAVNSPFALNDNLYILGGFDINVASTNQIWEFNLRAAVGSKWTQKVNTPMGVMYAPTCTISSPNGSAIYVAGASDFQGGTVVDTTNSFSFDSFTNTISSIAAIPRATGETRALSFNGKMLVMGGGRTPPNPSNEVDIYDPGSNTWTVGSPVPSFVTGRRNFPTDTDGNRHIWLAGGYASDGVTPLASMEIFECTSGEITLSARVRRVNGNRLVALGWTPADGGSINVLRDGVILRTVEDDGRAQDHLGTGQREVHVYQVCETDTGDCSNQVRVKVPGTGQ